jgi:hypothetical protein
MQYEGEFEIVVDNARMTTNQKAVPLPLTRDSLHSNSLHSSNHSTTRWEMNDSSHSTGSGATCSSISSHVSVLSAPTRKTSNDHVARVSLKPSSSKPKNGKKEKGKSRKSRKAPASLYTGIPPLYPSFKKEPLVPGMNQPGSSLALVKPSRKLSPILDCDPAIISLKTYLKTQGRSLSKTLGVADVHPQAPQLPTRRPSAQPNMYSPAASSPCSTKSIQAYTKIMDDIALGPTDRSSMRMERSISAVFAPPFLASPKKRPVMQKYKRRTGTNIFKSLNQSGSSLAVVKPSRKLSPILDCDPAVYFLKTYMKNQGRSLSKTLGVADVHPQAPNMPMRRPSTQPDVYSPAAPSAAGTKITDDIAFSPTDRSSMSLERSIPAVITPPILASPKRRVFPKPSGKWRRPLTKRS